MLVSSVERPVRALRQRTLEDMAIRGLRSNTQHDCIRLALVHVPDRGRDDSGPGPSYNNGFAADGIRASGAPASGSEPPRRWQFRSVGQRSYVLAAEVRSAPPNDPLSFRLASGGHSWWQPARLVARIR
jgi:hypothetical protein